jgi:hypothetical protein
MKIVFPLGLLYPCLSSCVYNMTQSAHTPLIHPFCSLYSLPLIYSTHLLYQLWSTMSSKHELKLRRPARELYVRSRHKCMTSSQSVDSKEIYESIVVLAHGRRHKTKVGTAKRLRVDRVLRKLMVQYMSILCYVDDQPLARQPNLRRNVASFTESHCKMNFRFLAPDLLRLRVLLQIPDRIKLDNRSWQSGEEILCRALFELTHGVNQEPICTMVFGGAGSDQSRAFTWFVRHVYNNFKHLVQNNLHWWFENGFFELSAAAIGHKMGCITTNLVTAFIDCNCAPTSVVGGGPAEEGANAAR